MTDIITPFLVFLLLLGAVLALRKIRSTKKQVKIKTEDEIALDKKLTRLLEKSKRIRESNARRKTKKR